MVEVQQFKLANEILETIVKEDDSLIEAWYLLAFCKFRCEKFKQALVCCKNVKE
jgi:cytochrome c-type biogenesis protein CcmH/NrfG